MNTKKEYPTFEELWTCCAQEESRINAKREIPKRNTTIKLLQQSSRISGIQRSLAEGRNHIKKLICQRYNASIVENMVTTGTTVLS
jgi:hypothetical protein